MRATPKVMAGVALIAWAGAVAGCGSSAGPKASGHSTHNPGSVSVSAASLFQSPEQATLSWFFAINHKDKAAAVAHFTPAAAGQMDWGYGDTSTWPMISAALGWQH